MDEGPYDVVVDTTLEPGELTYGELVLPGDSADEVMISAHVCHPSLANDNLAGIAVATEVARTLQAARVQALHVPLPLRAGHDRVPHLAQSQRRRAAASPARARPHRPGRGRAIWSTSGPGAGAAVIDRAAAHVVGRRGGRGPRATRRTATTSGSSTPSASTCPSGGCRARRTGSTPSTTRPRTTCPSSSPSELAESYLAVLEILDVLENDGRYENLSPYGEPQLGKRGLYPTTGGKQATDAVMAMLWVLAYSDGSTSLLDIAAVAGVDFAALRRAAGDLEVAGLLALAR